MKIKSFGKINLNLRVLDELVNGLHKIESLIVPIDLYDVIEIKEIKSEKDVITFDSMNIPENNTVSKSLNLLREMNDFSQYFQIKITKNIPTESGLGGGSSNAGALLSKLSQVYDLFIPSYEDVAQKIGSDVPFFINGQPAFVTGIGDVIEPKKIDIELNMLLAVPYEIVSTEKAFLEFDRLKNSSTLVNSYENIKIFNDFWNPSTRIEPNLIKIKDYLESSTGEDFFLSGSGSSMFCFGTLDNLQKKIDLIDKNQFRIVKIVKKIDFSLETISD
jgi:4-diphosphocytidyl-2-C-methyl-D-erythritol kinase